MGAGTTKGVLTPDGRHCMQQTLRVGLPLVGTESYGRQAEGPRGAQYRTKCRPPGVRALFFFIPADRMVSGGGR